MAEKLGEIGDTFSNICNAVKIAKSLKNRNGALFETIEQTKIQASEVEKIQIKDEPLLDELKQAVQKVRQKVTLLETCVNYVMSKTASFELFLEKNILLSTIPPGAIKGLCDDIQQMQAMVNNFTYAFEEFVKHLTSAQEVATNLAMKLKEKEQNEQNEQKSKESSTIIKGAAGTAGLVLAGVGLVALGFFTGGAAWVAAGAVAGAACGVGATVVGVNTASSVKEMRELASGILKDANKLDVIAKNLKSSADRAGAIKVNEEMAQALKSALEFFRRDKQKDEELAEKDARIAELEEKLRSLGH